MNPNYAFAVNSYNDIDAATGLTISQLVAANPQIYGMEDGPETPVGLPNLVTESVSPPGAETFRDAVTNTPYTVTAQHYIGGHPPHR